MANSLIEAARLTDWTDFDVYGQCTGCKDTVSFLVHLAGNAVTVQDPHVIRDGLICRHIKCGTSATINILNMSVQSYSIKEGTKDPIKEIGFVI
jgi:hypothetical protein